MLLAASCFHEEKKNPSNLDAREGPKNASGNSKGIVEVKVEQKHSPSI